MKAVREEDEHTAQTKDPSPLFNLSDILCKGNIMSVQFIRVKKKSQWGNDVIYPICDCAKEFARIANTKTLTEVTLKSIVNLGYDIIYDVGNLTSSEVKSNINEVEYSTKYLKECWRKGVNP